MTQTESQGRSATDNRSHYIREITSESLPRRYIYLDTEAHRIPETFGETQRWRLAVAQFERYSESKGWVIEDPERFNTPEELWYWVASKCIVSERTIMFCHNLGYDLRISCALEMLPHFGLSCSLLRLGEDVAWARWESDDGRVLIMSDTMSWVSRSLESIGRDLRMTKPPLPDEDDSQEAWFQRCIADVLITSRLWHTIRSWLWSEYGGLGPWRPTGTATAWACYRHRFLTGRILSHDDEDVRAKERHAAYCGRAEAFRHGIFRSVYEYDFEHAYASICRDFALPAILLDHSVVSPRRIHEETENALEYATGEGFAALVTCVVLVPEISLAPPPLPYRHDETERVIWPCGILVGTWWLDELTLAVRQGCVIGRVSDIRCYRTAPVLSRWARYLIQVIDTHKSPVIRDVAKQWSRTLVGRFGMRYPSYIRADTFSDDDLYAGWRLNGDGEKKSRRTLRIGSQLFLEDKIEDGYDTAPQIMSYVMMLTRLRLWDAMQRAGFDNVLYVDTDGLIVTTEGKRWLESNMPEGLRIKESYRQVELFGPKQILTMKGDHVSVRASGIPKSAKHDRKTGEWAYEEWERVRHSLEEGRTGEVRIKNVSAHMGQQDGRRIHLPGGETQAIEVSDARGL